MDGHSRRQLQEFLAQTVETNSWKWTPESSWEAWMVISVDWVYGEGDIVSIPKGVS